MSRARRTTALRGLAALALTGTLVACSQAPVVDSSAALGVQSPVVAFLMPDQASTRYERYDYPLFQAKVKDLCIRCDIVYANAEGDAELQRQQAADVLERGATVLVMSSVDQGVAAEIVESAQAVGAKVIAYDRPIVEVPADFYLSYDNEAIGELITESLLERLGGAAAEGGVLQVNGAPEDGAANLVEQGVTTALDGSGVQVLAEYDTPGWDPDRAEEWTATQIGRFGPQIVGVIAANDGTAGGAAAAFETAGVRPVPPITGNDSELAAAQRIVRGEQYNTISKPIRVVAEAAAAAAVRLVNGQAPQSNEMLYDTPTELFVPTVVTSENLRAVLIDTGELELSTVCTPELVAACRQQGVIE